MSLPFSASNFQFLLVNSVEVTIYQMENDFYKWLMEAVGGLILVGFGLSLFGQTVIYKARGEAVKKWFWAGTPSLIIINSGICVFGDAVKTRAIYELKSEQKTK